MTPATVRLWETKGLIPATRTQSGTRLFKPEDVEAIETERAVIGADVLVEDGEGGTK